MLYMRIYASVKEGESPAFSFDYDITSIADVAGAPLLFALVLIAGSILCVL
jgi:hypothetical protein